mgnify:CR=1 FL=1
MTNLPQCFKDKIEADKAISGKVVRFNNIDELRSKAKAVRKARSMCRAYLTAPKGNGGTA